MKFRGIIIVAFTLFAFFNQLKTNAQACSDILNYGQNLVKNGNFSDGFTGWTHSPEYKNYTKCNNCYSVPGNIYVGSVSKDFNSAFGNISDHSPGSDNKYLMVDGVCNLGINLWSQDDIPIEPKTNYFFSVYITSIRDTAPYGKLRFDIAGKALENVIDAPSEIGKWIKYTAHWYSGDNPPPAISISIQNLTTTGCAKAVDFAIDDISFSPGCEYGSPGPLPQLAADFDICGKNLPLTLNPAFNTATSGSNDVHYTWLKDGVVQKEGTGSDFYNLDVRAPGVYTICVDSAGSCLRSDKVSVNTNYTIDLTPEVTLCNPISALLDARYTGPGVTYQWFKGTAAIPEATNRTYLTTNPADYSVVVNDSICGQRTGNVKVKTSTAAPADSTYCTIEGGGNGITTLGVTGTGKYKWYTTPENGEVVTTGNSFKTPVLTGEGPHIFYVEDTSTFALQAGFSASNNNFTDANPLSESDGRELLVFNALTSFKLDSITVLPYNYYCPDPQTGNGNIVNLEIFDAQNNLVGSSQFSAKCETEGRPAPPLRVYVGIEIPQGNGYQMKLGTGSTQIAVYNNQSFAGTVYPAKFQNAVEFVSGSGGKTFPGYFDWKITRGVNCKRVPVQATEFCPKCNRSGPAEEVGADVTRFCEGSVSKIKLFSKGGFGEKLVWYKGACGGVKVDSSETGDTIVVDAPVEPTTYFARWESSKKCNSECLSVTVTPVKMPDQAVAGNAQILCNNTSTNLKANKPAAGHGTGNWSVVSGTAVFADAGNSETRINAIGAGELVLKWTIANAPCNSTEATVTIIRDTLSKPEITGAVVKPCVSTNDLVFSTRNQYNSAIEYHWNVAGDLNMVTSDTNRAVLNIGTKAATLFLTQKYKSCTLSDTLVLNPVQMPDTARAGEDLGICNLTSVNLNAVQPSIGKGTGSWSILTGFGKISEPNKSNSLLSDLKVGKVSIVWTVSNEPCPASSDTVVIQRDSLAKPAIPNDVPAPCEQTAEVKYSTSQNHSPASAYFWTVNGDSKVLNSFENQAGIKIGTTEGSLIVTEKYGFCALSDTIRISPVKMPTTASVPDTIGVCNLTEAIVSGNRPGVGKASWTKLSGTGDLKDTEGFETEVSGLTFEDLKLVYTISNTPCPASSDTVIVHRDTLSKPEIIGESFDICENSDSVQYTTLVNSSPQTKYFWYLANASHTALTIKKRDENRVVVGSAMLGGWLAVTEVFGYCALSDTQLIRTTPTVSHAAAGADLSICTDKISLAGINPVLGRGEWSVLNGTGKFEKPEDAKSLVEGLSEGKNSFLYTVYGCGGPFTDTLNIYVQVSNLEAVAYGPADTLCVGVPRLIGAMATGGSGKYIYHWTNSDKSFNDTIRINNLVITPEKEKITYYVFTEDSLRNSCFSDIDSVEVFAMQKQDLRIVNLVTANNDGKNENFVARDAHNDQDLLPGTHVQVVNRWGSQVFESHNYKNDWSPTDLTDGIYYYSMKAGCGGNEYKGWFHLIKSTGEGVK